MEELGNAINESLSDSDRIAAAIGEIKGSGYDVFLVLEATVGFNKRNDTVGAEAEADAESAFGRSSGRTGKIRWTSQDQKFLRALKISLGDESR